jgi:hypothetical protein
MIRHWKPIVILLLTLALGFALGWYLEGSRITESPVTEEVGAGNTVIRPKSKAGYCCMTAGSACVLMTAPVECFRQNGMVYNSNQELCDRYCLNVKP